MVLILTGSLGAAVLTTAGLTLRRIRAARPGDEPARAAAIVVLGAGVRDGRPCAELAARLGHARTLWLDGGAPVIVCSGGAAEAEAMRDWLRARGVPDTAIAADDAGVSTRATVASAARLGRAILVTSPWHVHRTRAEAARRGVDARVCSAGWSPLEARPLERRRQVAREVLASWWYAIPAWGSA